MKRLLVAFMLAAGGTSLMAQDKEQLPLLTVTGSSEVMVAPDQATVTVGVLAQASKAQDAQEQANQIAQRFLDAVAKLGIQKKDIQTSQLSLSPVYENPKPGEAPRISGYRAENSLGVRLDDFKLIGPVIDAGVASGANNIQGVSFSVKDDIEARLRALTLAAAEAKRKAETMAQALGITLDGVFDVVESGAQVMPNYYDGRGMAAMKAATPVEPGQISVNAMMTVRYAIKRK
ncbi:MAG TPA: SIMPL domain-containing protein [Fimbriimonadales bacterium]|jgi:uncharacterized protein YggE|nr:SIMPL domain-containing protein [Fimbriimonadales bacterium]